MAKSADANQHLRLQLHLEGVIAAETRALWSLLSA